MTGTFQLGAIETYHVWFVSTGSPAGCDLIAEDGELCLPGDSTPGDASRWWDLSGDVAGDRWEWDGRGNPRDMNGNSVTRIVAHLPRS